VGGVGFFFCFVFFFFFFFLVLIVSGTSHGGKFHFIASGVRSMFPVSVV